MFDTDVTYETYRAELATDGFGTVFYPDCGATLYSIKGPNAYHGRLCPACWERSHRKVVLYARGTKEADRVLAERKGN